MHNKPTFSFKQAGDTVVVSGENWEYHCIGSLSKFTQTGKIPSLRVIKTLIKNVSNLNLQHTKTLCKVKDLFEQYEYHLGCGDSYMSSEYCSKMSNLIQDS